ncbi:MAG: hypothetical protein AB8E15_07695 [Bdellovibrionales bacterium]
MKKIALIFALLFTVSACQTIHFKNGDQAGVNYPEMGQEKWHHTAVLGLIEVSEPVALQRECPKGWKSIKTEFGPLQFVVNMALNVVSLGWAYSPVAVAASCK